MVEVFALLIIFQIKHFLCDYPLQNEYMLGKFKPFPDWALPLIAHCSVHAAATLIIALVWGSEIAFKLAWLDFCIHFLMDHIKASKDLLGRWKPDEKYFWWSLGLDQSVHHLTHYAIIYFLVSGA